MLSQDLPPFLLYLNGFILNGVDRINRNTLFLNLIRILKWLQVKEYPKY